MGWFIPLLLAIAVFVTLISIGIGIDRMRNYMPVLAKLVRSDYSVSERNYDSVGAEFNESKLAKYVTMRMEFETAAGQLVRTSHKRWVPHGEMQKSCYSLWYNCEDPEKTTAYGPGFWLVVAAISACIGVMIMLDPQAWLEAFALAA